MLTNRPYCKVLAVDELERCSIQFK